MILMVEPVVKCVREVSARSDVQPTVVVLTPSGRRLDQIFIEELATKQRIMMLCGRYEGFDERVCEILKPIEISVGDYILNGGEVAAMVLVDAIVRMIPGVLGDEFSNWDDSFSRGNRRLEYPQYTRPREFEGHCVPDVLLSGNHEQIKAWRAEKSLEKTANRRSDLLD
jgi:tRNA (guanine37-N1)-methyltransferase